MYLICLELRVIFMHLQFLGGDFAVPLFPHLLFFLCAVWGHFSFLAFTTSSRPVRLMKTSGTGTVSCRPCPRGSLGEMESAACWKTKLPEVVNSQLTLNSYTVLNGQIVLGWIFLVRNSTECSSSNMNFKRGKWIKFLPFRYLDLLSFDPPLYLYLTVPPQPVWAYQAADIWLLERVGCKVTPELRCSNTNSDLEKIPRGHWVRSS